MIRTGLGTFRFACQERISVHREEPRLFFPSGFPKGVIRRTDLDIDKSDFRQHCAPAFARKPPGISPPQKIDIANRPRRHRLPIGDIAELQPSTGTQDPPQLRESLPLVSAEIDDSVADNDIGPSVPYRNLFQKALAKLDLLEPHDLGRCAGLFQHLREHVNADDFALWAHLAARDEAIKAPT